MVVGPTVECQVQKRVRWNTDDVTTEADRPALYVGYTPAATTPIFSWNAPPTPTDGVRNNTYAGVNISASCTLGGGVNIWWNGTVAISGVTSEGSFLLNSSLITGDGEYSYWGSCDTEANSTARTFNYDSNNPIISLNPTNGFNASNITLNPYSSTLQLNITVTDNLQLFGFLVNITHPNGTSYFSVGNASLSGTSYTFEKLLDMTNWPATNYSVNIAASDSHTANKIDDYIIDKPLGGGKLRFETSEGNIIRIETDLFSKADTIKEEDRYKFSFDYLGSGSKDRTFHVKSDIGKIRYMEDSKYKAHFVIGSPLHGNWVDFEGLPGDPTVKKIDDYHYTVTFKNVPEKVTFSSIGGLNIAINNFKYVKNSLDLTDVSINPTTPINLDNLGGYATGVSGQGDLINYSWRWYANGTFYSSGYKVTTAGTINLANITANYTNLGSNWTFSSMLSVPGNSTAWVNSSQVTIATQNLNVSIFNEQTLAYLTQNVTILISSDNYERTQYTSTGQAAIADLQDGNHSFTFSATNYSTRTYIVTLSNSTQKLNAYLAPGASDLTLTIKDQNNGAFIENALAIQYRIINNLWVPMEIKYTDITGRVVFSYLPSVKYRFVIAKGGYETNTFELNPVVFSSYDVYLTPTSAVDPTLDYDRLVLLYSPRIFKEGNNSNLWLISSPFGELTTYGYTLTYPGGSSTSAGANSQGSMLSDTFNITGSEPGDRVKMDMYYISSVGGTKNFTLYFPILTNATAGTLEANRDNHYGLGLLERILIMTFSVLFVVGISTLIGRPLEGMGLGLFLMGWFVYIGFISFWAIAISLIVGLIIISARSSD